MLVYRMELLTDSRESESFTGERVVNARAAETSKLVQAVRIQNFRVESQLPWPLRLIDRIVDPFQLCSDRAAASSEDTVV
jgi:hypothetical protein